MKELDTNGFFIMDDGSKSNDQTNILKKRKLLQNKANKKDKKKNKLAKQSENSKIVTNAEEADLKSEDEDEQKESQD